MPPTACDTSRNATASPALPMHLTSAAIQPKKSIVVPNSSARRVGLISLLVASSQGLTLVHFSAQHKHSLWDTLSAWFPPSLLDRGTR